MSMLALPGRMRKPRPMGLGHETTVRRNPVTARPQSVRGPCGDRSGGYPPGRRAADQEQRRRQPRAGDAAGTPGRPTGTSDRTASAQTGKLTRAADLLPSVSAPTGGGAIRGLDEKFSVNAATGTGSMAVKLPFSPGRSGFTPALELAEPFRLGKRAAASAGAWGYRRSRARPLKGFRSTATVTSQTSSSWPAQKTWCPYWTRPGLEDAEADSLRDALHGHLLPPARRRPVFPHRALDRNRHGRQPLADPLT